MAYQPAMTLGAEPSAPVYRSDTPAEPSLTDTMPFAGCQIVKQSDRFTASSRQIVRTDVGVQCRSAR